MRKMAARWCWCRLRPPCARRCYATTGERILLDFRVDGELMGSEIAAGDARRISGRVIGTAELETVEIIRNGETWREIPTEGREAVTFELEDTDDLQALALTSQAPAGGRFVFYYLRVVQRDRHWAMSSPLWVTL